MDSIAVCEQDMTVLGQESLSPFGLLTQLFTKSLIERNQHAVGAYRPMRLAYLEEDEDAAQRQTPPEIHVDLDLELIVNRLQKEEQKREQERRAAEKTKAGRDGKDGKPGRDGKDGRDGKSAPAPKTPAERILERVIVREKELRVTQRDSRRVVVVGADGRRTELSLPTAAKRTAETAERPKQEPKRLQARQPEEDRGTQEKTVPLRSAGLTRLSYARSESPRALDALHRGALPLASAAMSVPAAGGWTPKRREAHPGYPGEAAQPQSEQSAAGSILLPDVLRRRREEAMARLTDSPAVAAEAEDWDDLTRALEWSAEGTEEEAPAPAGETERALREVRRAVEETLRRNRDRESGTQSRTQTQPRAETAQTQTRAASHADGAIPAAEAEGAIPAAEAEGTEESPAELSYRAEKTETAAREASAKQAKPASAEARAEQTSKEQTPAAHAAEAIKENAEARAEAAPLTVQPRAETAERTAIPAAEAEGAEELPTELSYRAEKTETATRETSAEQTNPALTHAEKTASAEARAEQTSKEQTPAAHAAEAIKENAEARAEAAPLTVQLRAEMGERTAIPAAEAERAEEAPTELSYRAEKTEPAEREASAPQSEAASPAPARAEKTASAEERAEQASKEQTPATAHAAEAIKESPEERADAVPIDAKPRAEKSARTAIPAAEAEGAEAAPAELSYRAEKTETAEGEAPAPQSEAASPAPAHAEKTETAEGRAERTGKEQTPAARAAEAIKESAEARAETAPLTVQPRAEKSARTAIPAAAEGAEESPAELSYRAEKTETAEGEASAPQSDSASPAPAHVEKTATAEGRAEQAGKQQTPAAAHAAEAIKESPEERTDAAPIDTHLRAEKSARTAIPAAEAEGAEESPAELSYRAEKTETASREASAEQTNPALTHAEKTASAETRAERTGKEQTPATAHAAEAIKESPEERADAVPIDAKPRAEKSARTAIPAAEAEGAEAVPAELSYRAEKTETASREASAEQTNPALTHAEKTASAETRAERTGKEQTPAAIRAAEAIKESAEARAETAPLDAQPRAEKSTRTAIPAAEAEGAEESPAELSYRAEKGETAEKAAPVRTVFEPARKSTAARDIRSPLFHGNETARKAKDIRVTAAERLVRPAARQGVPAPEEDTGREAAELFFAARPEQADAQAPAARTAEPQTEKKAKNAAENLPKWARDLFENEEQAAAAGKALFGAPDAAKGTIRWSAPGATPPPRPGQTAAGPAQIDLKQPQSAAEAQSRQHISDAELQRTADKVYRMIEERLRRDLRRSGR